MEEIGPVKRKLKKKIKRSSMMKKKNSLMEDVVSQMLPNLKAKEETVFLIPEEKIRKTEENGNERLICL